MLQIVATGRALAQSWRFLEGIQYNGSRDLSALQKVNSLYSAWEQAKSTQFRIVFSDGFLVMWINRLNTDLLLDRSTRALQKLTWTAQSLAASPQIETVHRREVAGAEEFVRVSKGPTYIEPKWGYVITETGCLIEESLTPNFDYHKPPWRVGVASPGAFFKSRRVQGEMVQRYPSVISLRHLWEWNYYHFYLDTIGKLRLFDEAGIPQSTPIVVGRYAMELPFVREVLGRGQLKNRNWIIQDNVHIVADEVYYGRTRQSYKHKMDYILDLMEVPESSPQTKERTFLARSRYRAIANMDEIAPILKRHGFNVVFAEKLPLEDQIEIFSRTRFLIAAHGAGMTNIIFRRHAPMNVLEVHGKGFVSEDFKLMCREWGFPFDRLACESDEGNQFIADIYIEPEALEAKIDRMLAFDAVGAS